MNRSRRVFLKFYVRLWDGFFWPLNPRWIRETRAESDQQKQPCSWKDPVFPTSHLERWVCSSHTASSVKSMIVSYRRLGMKKKKHIQWLRMTSKQINDCYTGGCSWGLNSFWRSWPWIDLNTKKKTFLDPRVGKFAVIINSLILSDCVKKIDCRAYMYLSQTCILKCFAGLFSNCDRVIEFLFLLLCCFCVSFFVFCFFIVFQIWDLADPDGKGYLDKQVGT